MSGLRPMARVDLSTCDREPIHVPGSIQPHGALLAFAGDGRLAAASENAPDLLGPLPAIGGLLDDTHLDAAARERIAEVIEGRGSELDPVEVALPSGLFDAILHRSGPWLVAEFEQRPADAPALHGFAIRAQRALERIQRQQGIEGLLEVAVEEVRAMTGFDRVMAYRFRHDDSGEVAAESRHEDLEPFLGLRYPASDIPAQARRLYRLNPLRMIVDVNYRPVPVLPPDPGGNGEPLDMSHGVLRSVSPIHVEYLRNMGIAASMSISILVGGRLWGLIACHHMAPRFVPHAVRIACELLARVAGVLVERAETAARSERLEHAGQVRRRLVERLEATSDLTLALAAPSPSVGELVRCDGFAVVLDGRVRVSGQAPDAERVRALVASLQAEADADEVVADHRLADSQPDVVAASGVHGVLAARYYGERGGWVLWFRREEIADVRWGGNPDKIYDEGPLGPRLTPRGSFAEYRQQVRGQSEPWGSEDVAVARALVAELQRIVLARVTETERMRELVMATLSHDLRDPLHAIAMAAQLIGRSGMPSEQLGRQIVSSSGRMARLVTIMLDAARLQQGSPIDLTRVDTDVAGLLGDLVAETATAHPHLVLEVDLARAGRACIDPDRLTQLVGNLLSNARHHGEIDRPIQLGAWRDGGDLVVEVANHGAPIDPAIATRLFEAFSGGARQPRNRTGLGLGLYIARAIAQAHGGDLHYRHEGGLVRFRARLQAQPA